MPRCRALLLTNRVELALGRGDGVVYESGKPLHYLFEARVTFGPACGAAPAGTNVAMSAS